MFVALLLFTLGTNHHANHLAEETKLHKARAHREIDGAAHKQHDVDVTPKEILNGVDPSL
jgi:hypothetical protein